MNKKQDWKSEKVDIRNSPIEGKGLFSNSDIEEGEKLIIWGGDYVNKEEAEKYRKAGKLVMQWDDNLYSYEDRGDDDGYFINHSCDPNMWMIDAYTLVAKRPIKAGEELTADYIFWEDDEDYVSKWECNCRSLNCRKRITGKDWQNPELQKLYKGHFSPLLNKRIQRRKQDG